MSEYLEAINEAEVDLADVAYRLQHLSTAFCVTGNTLVGTSLDRLANQVEKARETINRAVGEEINARLHDSQESAKDVVGAALAAVALKGGP